MLKTTIFLFCVWEVVIATSCPTLSNAITQTDILHAVRASKDVYNDHVIEGSFISGTPFKVIKRIHKDLFTDAGIRVIVADSGNTRMIVYRGTDGREQLLVEGGSVFEKKAIVHYGNKEVKIMKFFWDAFELVSYDLKPFIEDPSKKYIITGHSLGGALASIMALNGTQLFQGSLWANPQSSLITFGQPRVGDASFANLHDALISTYRKLRFVYMGDIVARNPGHEFGWRHHSRAVYMGEESSGGLFGWFGDEIEQMDSQDKKLLNEDDENLNKILKDTDLMADRVDAELQDFLDTVDGVNDKESYFEEASHAETQDYSQPEDQKKTKDDKDESSKDSPIVAQDSNMRKFWTICSTQRAYFCITYTKHFIPTIDDHAMDKYVKSVEETGVFRTRQNTEKTSFNEALVAACEELEG